MTDTPPAAPAATPVPAPAPVKRRHRFLFNFHRDWNRTIVRLGLTSSLLLAVMMVLVVFERQILLSFHLNVEWAMIVTVVVAAWFGAMYGDLQTAQVLARSITDTSHNTADNLLSILPLIAMGVIGAFAIVGLFIGRILPLMGWQEWTILSYFTYRAFIDVIYGPWIFQRLTGRTVSANEQVKAFVT